MEYLPVMAPKGPKAPKMSGRQSAICNFQCAVAPRISGPKGHLMRVINIPLIYSRAQELFYKFVSNFTK